MNQISTALRLTQPPETSGAPISTLDAERRAASLLLSSGQGVRDEVLNIACSLMGKVARRTITTRDVEMSPPAPHEAESVAARIVVRPHPSLLSGMLQIAQPSAESSSDEGATHDGGF